jgi:hypothetical protein
MCGDMKNFKLKSKKMKEKNNKKRLFLDDCRQPNECTHYMHHRIGKENFVYLEEWDIVRNYDEFVEYIKKNAGNISYISYDHDLADVHYNPMTQQESFEYQEKTGYDAAKWMKEYYEKHNLDFPRMYCHSQNPVGTRNIINVFK